MTVAAPSPVEIPVGGFCVAPSHPCLPGHFPGDAIVPGAVILDEVIALVAAHAGGRTVAGVPSAKFVEIVRPGDSVEVTCRTEMSGRIGFTCSVRGSVVARGAFTMRNGDAR